MLLQALTCLSEAPEGRKTLLEHVDKVREATTAGWCGERGTTTNC